MQHFQNTVAYGVQDAAHGVVGIGVVHIAVVNTKVGVVIYGEQTCRNYRLITASNYFQDIHTLHTHTFKQTGISPNSAALSVKPLVMENYVNILLLLQQNQNMLKKYLFLLIVLKY